MIVINNGKKIIEGDVGQLMSSELMKVRIKVDQPKLLVDLFNAKNILYTQQEEFTTISVKENEIRSIINLIVENNIAIDEVRQLRTLEELFLKLTQ